jgi:hypothetical protein
MRQRPSPSEILAWTLFGSVIGVVAGFTISEWLGPITPARVGDVLTRGAGQRPPRLTAAGTAQAARLALEQDLELHHLGLKAIPVGRGVVELHGWVPDRRLRARAARVAAAADGIESLVNCLLVRGEDDVSAGAPDATDQPA